MEDNKIHQLEEAEKFLLTGEKLFKQSKFSEAIEVFNKSEKIFTLYKKWEKYVQVKLNIVECLNAMTSYQESWNTSQELLEFTEEHFGTESLQSANAYLSFKNYWSLYKGDYQKCIDYIKKALQIYENIVPSHYIKSIQANLIIADSYRQLGQYRKAKELTESMIYLLNKYHRPSNTFYGNAYINLGEVYRIQKDFDKSLSYFHRALAVWKHEENNKEPDLAMIYNCIGTVLGMMGNYREQLYYLEKSLQLRIKIFGEMSVITAYTYHNMGAVLGLLNEYDKAIKLFEKTVSIRKKLLGVSHPLTLVSLKNIAVCLYNNKKPKKALPYALQVLKLRVEVLGNKHPSVGLIYSLVAGIYYTLFDYKKALEAIQSALIAICINFNDSDITANPLPSDCFRFTDLIEFLSTKAQFLKKSNYPNHNQQTIIEIYALIFKIQWQNLYSYSTEKSKISLVEMTTNRAGEEAITFYYECFQSAQNQYYLIEIFKLIQMSKAISLLNGILNVNAKKTIPNILLKEEKFLNRQLQKLRLKIVKEQSKEKGSNKDLINRWQVELGVFQEKKEDLALQFEQNYPEYYRLKYDIETVGIETLQQSISEEQLMISYFIGEKHVYIFGITKGSFEVLQQKKLKNFNQLIKDFNKGLNRLMFKKYVLAAHELYQILLAPVLQHPSFNNNTTIKQYSNKSIQKLIITPHDTLTTLPFEALLCSLPEKLSNNLQYADLDYLLLHYDVVYHYSATLWWQGQKDEQKSELKESFVGFAPVYQEGQTEPQKEQRKTKEPIVSTKHPQHLNELVGMRSIQIGTKIYNALLYSEEEVRGIQAAFALKQFPHQTFLHEQATKSNFEAAIKGKKYVLIAAHGFYNKEQPDLSGIIFSPNDSEKSEDVVLYVDDAYHLDLKQTDLVVLSACESGIGKLAKGEGMIAVNRGFLYSGAKNVIFTLFKVYDRQSSELTQALFRYILAGSNYAQALRLAKLELIRESDADPKAWAGFVMIGA